MFSRERLFTKTFSGNYLEKQLPGWRGLSCEKPPQPLGRAFVLFEVLSRERLQTKTSSGDYLENNNTQLEQPFREELLQSGGPEVKRSVRRETATTPDLSRFQDGRASSDLLKTALSFSKHFPESVFKRRPPRETTWKTTNVGTVFLARDCLNLWVRVYFVRWSTY